MDNQDEDQSQQWQEYQARLEAAQIEKEAESKAKLDQIEKELPKEEVILRLQQTKAKEEVAKNLAELEKFEATDEIINPNQFKQITCDQVIQILGKTIKKDDTNKLINFLALLSAFTEDCQINISFNAPSSSGKSFIPLEVAQLFPEKDIIKLGGCSPTAFYHEQGKYDKEKNLIEVDLSRKIIIFLDQPNSSLLERLRSLLSHDEKIIYSKITDKNQKGGNRTKTVAIIGYPAVVFCTASLNFDEQESTRFLLLSPELTQEKLREAILEKISKSSNRLEYVNKVESDPERSLFKLRIKAIKQEHITDINIPDEKVIVDRFFSRVKNLKPKHQRDIARIINIVKIFALLNLWFRKRSGDTIYANDTDIDEAFKVWDAISEAQELNLPPYVLEVHKKVIIPAYLDKNGVSGINDTKIIKLGLTRQDISNKHYAVYNRFLPDWQLRQWILPMLETAGLIIQEPDLNDKRKLLVHPTSPLTISNDQNNSETTSGVDLVEVAEEIFGSKAEEEVSNA